MDFPYPYSPPPVAQRVKHPPAMPETRVWSLSWEDLLEKEMATHSSTLAWRIPWMEEPSGLQSMGLQSQTWLSDFTSHEWFNESCLYNPGFPGSSVVKNLPAGNVGSILELGESPGEGNGNPLQYFCLGNPMDIATWWATVRGVTKSQTQLSTQAWLCNKASIKTQKDEIWGATRLVSMWRVALLGRAWNPLPLLCISSIQLFLISRSVMSDSLQPCAHQFPLSMRILQARILEWVGMPSSRGSSDPGNEPGSPTLQADSSASELPEKPQAVLGLYLFILHWWYS